MNIEIDWQYTGAGEDNLDFSRALYAYLYPETEEILYLGNAGRCTVRERLFGAHKETIFSQMIDELQITELHAIVGVVYLPEGRRYSSELLADIESLFIMELHYNSQSRKSRISRRGMMVRCTGEWPHEQDWFNDD